ncbi:MAG: hypothetical protein M1826_004360 [Phylliscum demangeonii]|nr:MAG: hypothetical protein M1826_004360 [Phylliscum demangeonii]
MASSTPSTAAATAATVDDTTDVHFLRQALAQADKAPLRADNYRVGALLVADGDGDDGDDANPGTILATGYTHELPGNTHAEECCLLKYAALAAEHTPGPHRVALYTTMEPCVRRLSGKMACVQRIERWRKATSGVGVRVVVGVREPDTFVRANDGLRLLEEAGVRCCVVSGLEQEIMRVATAGHGPTTEGKHD